MFLFVLRHESKHFMLHERLNQRALESEIKANEKEAFLLTAWQFKGELNYANNCVLVRLSPEHDFMDKISTEWCYRSNSGEIYDKKHFRTEKNL